jgi:aminoglycoside phosphotransferase (APT) family kinase protein
MQPEVRTDAPLVRRLIADQFPSWADLPIVPVTPRGTDNVLYRLGSDMVVRLPRRQIDAVRLAKELHWLPKLSPLLPLATPVPLIAGQPADKYPYGWAVYRWLEGETANDAGISDLARAATDLASFLAALRSVDPTEGPTPGAHNSFRGVPLAVRDEVTRAAMASLQATMNVPAIASVWEEARRVPEWNHEPVWIHGDLDGRNMLVHEGRISAVIDFGCLGVGDPACDVMIGWKVLTPDSRIIFRKALSVDDQTWIRARGWALSQALVALSSYTLETNPTLVREAHRWIEQVLADGDASRR